MKYITQSSLIIAILSVVLCPYVFGQTQPPVTRDTQTKSNNSNSEKNLLFQRYKDNYQSETIEGKQKALAAAKEYIKLFNTPENKEIVEYLKQAIPALEVAIDELKKNRIASSPLANSKYDRFTDLSTVTIPLSTVKTYEGIGTTPADLLITEVEMVYEGKEPKNIKSFSLKFNYTNIRPSNRIADTDKAYLIADEQRFEIPFEYPFSETWLVVEVPLKTEVRKAISSANKVELKLSRRIIEFSQNELKIIRNLINSIPSTANTKPTNNIPLAVRKVSSFLEVSSDQIGFLDIPVKTNGVIAISDFYYGAYRNAQSTHFAFQVWDTDSRPLRGYLYMQRGTKADELRRQILAAPRKAILGSFTFIISKDKFESSSNTITAELIEYGALEK